MDGGGEREDLFLHPLQLFGVVLMEDDGECGHAVPKNSVPSLFVLWDSLTQGCMVMVSPVGLV